jgi:hypothetical protein
MNFTRFRQARFNQNYSRRQASGLMLEAIPLDSPELATVFADSPIHFVGELSKPQTWNNPSMKQASCMSTPTHRE